MRTVQFKTLEGPVLKSRFFFLVGALVLILAGGTAGAQDQRFKDLKDQYTLNAELYFYASTLRMINIQRDPDFDEMVKDIRKMTFFQLDGPDNSEVRALSMKFLGDGDFEELMTMEDPQQLLYIMAREDEYVALMKTDQGLTAVNLMGSIGVHKIPELINSFNSDNFLNVFEVGKGEREEHRRENDN